MALKEDSTKATLVTEHEQYVALVRAAGCPMDQMQNFFKAGILLQPTQLAASAAARLCDKPGGPKAIGYGGARGGGKSHWLLSQMGADDCQRVPGLKCLLLRKVGKSNLENLQDFAQRLFQALPHEFNLARGITFANGSRIVLGHYQHEKDLDQYLGLEYDVIAIDEATQLTARKYNDISTCCRTSKPNWRPRIYTATNPGGIGHQWYMDKFIVPHQCKTESATRFISARVEDNAFVNDEYTASLGSLVGWQYQAWRKGFWNFAAGQFFRTFHPDIHIFGGDSQSTTAGTSRSDVPAGAVAGGTFPADGRDQQGFPQILEEISRCHRFRESHAVEWFAAMDYGYAHYTVVLLGCTDHENNFYIIDEHAERFWSPERHALAIKAMLARHNLYSTEEHAKEAIRAKFPNPCHQQDFLWHQRERRMLTIFSAGGDMFSRESNGTSVAAQYAKFGIKLRHASMERVSGWSAILQRMGDLEAAIKPTLFIHHRCKRLLETLTYLQHDPDRPGDVLKINPNEEGVGGDDAADALRYLIATKPIRIYA